MFNILVAEDNPADLFLIQEALKTHNVPSAIHGVTDGEAFLEYAQQACEDGTIPKPDLIILDWSLPKNSGAELIKAIRETERCANAPIFVLTSSISPHVRKAATDAGASQFIAKPTELDDFLNIGAVVRDVLFRGNSASSAN